MIAVDTSVWIAAFRDAESEETEELGRLLDRDQVALPVPVRMEILSGASTQDGRRLRPLLGALPQWHPEVSTWRLIESWIEQAVRAGERFGVGDLLIGAIARQRGASVWSLDNDFRRMANLGFLQRYEIGSALDVD